jgi:hypothetical protein
MIRDQKGEKFKKADQAILIAAGVAIAGWVVCIITIICWAVWGK